MICRHECGYHKYANDTQLSKGAPPDQFQSLRCDIQACIENLVDWIYSNKLKLNSEETEVLPVASTSRLSSVGRDSAGVGGKRIPFRSSVRNLGVHLDQTLSMQQHISSVCRAAYLELRRMASIRPYLTQSAANCPTRFICHNIPAHSTSTCFISLQFIKYVLCNCLYMVCQ